NRIIAEIPFDSQRKAMSVVVETDRRERRLYCKGAPEAVLEKCDRELRGGALQPLTAARRQELAELQAELSSRAYRVLGFAAGENPEVRDGSFAETGLVFAGLVAMSDPPREEVRLAIARCREAGIKPVMITGDHPLTARAIALDLGLAEAGDRVLTGQDLAQLTPSELTELVPQVGVYARVLAEHKLAIVRAWQSRDETVAMTGDGVNDAPAVKMADIGIAMGVTGTDVTKEAADIVLMDDNFASIVNAVEEGRGIYDNIQKFVHYLLACNAGEVLVMFLASLAGWPSPLTAIQILWINLVTDGLPALALGLEPPEPDIMQRQPRPLRQRLITRQLGLQILTHGLLIALVSLGAFAYVYEGPANLNFARTIAFCVMACSQLFFALACRSQRFTLPELGIGTNWYLFAAMSLSFVLQVGAVALVPLEKVFDVERLSLSQWGLVLVLSLIPVTIVEVFKLLRAAWRRHRRDAAPV
ncbi:MAG: cation-transporting P-type ATPase, partial [Planctomycetaceae bacterium]|nr:cation-transporting P-type ATPase [Planctomycetaceae bacterium]